MILPVVLGYDAVQRLHTDLSLTDRKVTMADPMKRLPVQPVERALKVIAGRWKAIILYQLFDQPRRLTELKGQMPRISQKVLIQQLREMEEHGLVHREIFQQMPPRVDYSVTALGLSLEPIIRSLCDWGRKHAADLDDLASLSECRLPPAERAAAA